MKGRALPSLVFILFIRQLVSGNDKHVIYCATNRFYGQRMCVLPCTTIVWCSVVCQLLLLPRIASRHNIHASEVSPLVRHPPSHTHTYTHLAQSDVFFVVFFTFALLC
jgi:hypothetical protein